MMVSTAMCVCVCVCANEGMLVWFATATQPLLNIS